MMNGFNKIYNQEGVAGFFRGLLPRIMRKGMGSIICWTFYEFLIDRKDAFIAIG
jgi:glutathione peroxidase-family protein